MLLSQVRACSGARALVFLVLVILDLFPFIEDSVYQVLDVALRQIRLDLGRERLADLLHCLLGLLVLPRKGFALGVAPAVGPKRLDSAPSGLPGFLLGLLLRQAFVVGCEQLFTLRQLRAEGCGWISELLPGCRRTPWSVCRGSGGGRGAPSRAGDECTGAGATGGRRRSCVPRWEQRDTATSEDRCAG